MKFISATIISISILFLTNCNHEKENVELLVKLGDKIEKDSLSLEYPGCSYFKCELEILNNSDTIFYFWSMNCSWYENWISTSDSVLLINKGCAKNFPELYELYPKKGFKYNCIVGFKDSYKSLGKMEYKFGFVHVMKCDLSSPAEFDRILYLKKKNLKDIIWSQPMLMMMN